MAKKKVTRPHISLKEWETIKTLQSLGLSPSEAATAAKRANSTVGYIYESESFEGYRQISRERNKVVPKQEPEAQPEQESPVAQDELVKQLTRIADGIENLVNAWQDSPRKKKLF